MLKKIIQKYRRKSGTVTYYLKKKRYRLLDGEHRLERGGLVQ